MQSFSIADARAQLPKIIHAVETGDVTQLTRRGKPVAILLSLKEYETLLSYGKGGWFRHSMLFRLYN
jgi:prevent-host-death family protein